MPQQVPRFEDQSTESEELCPIPPHCTWCALHANRLQERFARGRRETYVQGDSSSSSEGERKLMCSRRKAQKPTLCGSGRDSSDDECLSQKEDTGRCGRYGRDVQEKCSHVRNICECSHSQGQATCTNARHTCCPCPDEEFLKTCEEGKGGCDDEQETADGAGKNVRQIVMESRCPCLCAYLQFTDTVDACTCVRRLPSCTAPECDSKTANVPDNLARLPSAPKDKNRFCCCIARYFLPFRKRSKRSSRDVDTHHPSPLPLEQKNSLLAGDGEITKDTCYHKDLDRCGKCQISYRKSELLKSTVSRKPSKRESYQSASVQRENTDTAPRESTAVMGRDSCLKCQRAEYGLEDAEKVQSRVRCTCDCESRNKDLKRFRSSLQRLCRALSGCKRDTCACECHGKQGEEKENGNDTRILNDEENRRRKRVNRGSGEKTPLPKRGLLALKYEILRCKELEAKSKEAESGSSVCEWNRRGCHCCKEPPGTEQRCSRKDVRSSGRKRDKCCIAEENKCTRKACLDEQNKPKPFETYKSKNDSREREDTTVPKANNASKDEMIVNHTCTEEKVKQKRCNKRKSKLRNAQRLQEGGLSGRPAGDSTDESELEGRKSRARKEREVKTNHKHLKGEDDDDSDPMLDPMSAEVVKIGDRYYQAIRHRTAHVNIMSFKNLKNHREIHGRRKDKKSPRIEVRVRYDTTSSDEGSSEASVLSNGPLGDSACHPPKLEHRKPTKRRIKRDKPVKKANGSATKEAKLPAKKGHCVSPSTGAAGGEHSRNSPTAPVKRKLIDVKEADKNDSSVESMSCDLVERLPKAMTDPPPSPEKAMSPLGWKSEGTQLKKKGLSARTLELKQMSDRWFSSDTKQWCNDKAEIAGDSGTCDVRPFTASSSAS